MQVTRSLTTFALKAYDVELKDDGTAAVNVVAETDLEAPSITNTVARKALDAAYKAAHPEDPKAHIKKGTAIRWTEVSKQLYSMDLETFLAHAEKVGEPEAPSETVPAAE